MIDLIDRKEAIKVISNDSLDVKCFCVIGRGQKNRELEKTINDYVNLLLETVKRKILSLPKADTERHAHWIEDEYCGYYTCSNCDGIGTANGMSPIEDCHLNYCPYCGAKMDEVEDETQNNRV